MAQIGPRDDPASRPRRFLLPPGGAALNEGKRMGWSRKLSPPLVLRDGRVLQTLSEAREMILGLPEGQQRAALQRDLDLASQVQRNLLPQKGLRVGCWETSYHFAPVGAVSGDYCDLIPSDGRLLFLLGDVSGKGVAASMLMAQLHALFRSLTGMSLPLGQIVTFVNRFFCECALAGQYATLVCGLAKPTGEVEIHNAGHCPAIVVGRGGVSCIEPNGLPLGMFLETEFSATPVQLEAGDTLFLYTDGLSEASNESGEYGVDRIMTLVHQQAARQPAELIDACLDDVRAFTNGVPSFDDMTVLALRRCG